MVKHVNTLQHDIKHFNFIANIHVQTKFTVEVVVYLQP